MQFDYNLYKSNKDDKQVQRELVLEHVRIFIQKRNRVPSINELSDQGLTRAVIRETFQTIHSLIYELKNHEPTLFSKMFIDEDFSEEEWKKTKAKISGKKRVYVITTVEDNGIVRRDCLKSIETYCKHRNGTDLYIPSAPGKNKLTDMDPILKGKNFILNDVYLNRHLKICPIQMSQKAIKPTTGLSGIGTRSVSVIYPSSKLTLEPIATDIDSSPHYLITTGALTQPKAWGTLQTTDEKELSPEMMSNIVSKSDYVNVSYHEISALIVEIYDDNYYFMREAMFDIDGSFVDISPTGYKRFHPNGKITPVLNIDSLTPGDYHCLETSQTAKKTIIELLHLLGPNKLNLHDFYSHLAHGHHTFTNPIVGALIEEMGLGNPINELKFAASELRELLKAAKKKNSKAKVNIIKSNHDEHLEKAVIMGILSRDTTRRFGSECTLALLDGRDLIEWGIERYSSLTSPDIKFLSRESKLTLENFFGNLAQHFHGDKGNRGAKNSATLTGGLAVSSGCATVGHTHEDRILPGNNNGGLGNGGVWYVGTSQVTSGKYRPEYSKGSPGAWMQSMIVTITSPGGRILRQHLRIIGGIIGMEFGTPKEYEDLPTMLLGYTKIKK